MAFPEPFFRWRPHPWHGLSIGKDAPRVVTAYIEITPFDSIKYELDKSTGYLRVDRPQRGSAQPPALYGLIPKTYCGSRTAALTEGLATRGDNDPLDICVIAERPVTRSDIILNATVVGGLQMIDGGEADDKIVAILENDLVWGKCRDIDELPANMVERLTHYFATYKMMPGNEAKTDIAKTYGWEHAKRVIEAAQADYAETYGE